MRLKVTKSKNAASLYVIKSTYENKVNSSKIVEKLGTEKELREKLGGKDPYEWAKEYIAELNKKEKENKQEVLIKYAPHKLINKDEQLSFNCGYLFLQDIYHKLGLHKICSQMQERYKATFCLDAILSRLVYSRILFPASKRATYDLSKNFLETPCFEEHHIYRSLEIFAKEMDFIQASLYQNKQKAYPANSRILFYDCTNFFFSIEQEDDFRKYGRSKDNQPSPLVQMGLFMDSDGIPLAIGMTPGNQNEQPTLKPLEKQIIKDFKLSKIIVCTDAGLASTENRKFNNIARRSFVTTESIKKMKKEYQDWALNMENWSFTGSKDFFNISDIQSDLENEKDQKKYLEKLNRIYYKERWRNDDDLEQRMIVTYSPKYAQYQAKIRNRQLERAEKLIHSGEKKSHLKTKMILDVL